MNEFAEWDSFYLIIGGAAGALIGLQFVVLTLIADRGRRASADAGRAFSTPTVLHFSVVLFLAAFMRVPWPSIYAASIVGGLVGAAGTIYILMIIRGIRTQKAYRPVLEDWLFHAVLPLASYLTLFVLAFVAIYDTHIALFGGAAATLVLLFTGIHNAWDAVTWHVFDEPADHKPKRKHRE
jgi:hypothetical protein